MRTDLIYVWIHRMIWATAPLYGGSSFAEAAEGRQAADFILVSLWILWAVALAVHAYPHPLGLLAVRIISPASVAAAIWMSANVGLSVETGLVIVLFVLATLVCLSSPVGAFFVGHGAHPEEKRFLISPPISLLFGPLELVWAGIVCGISTGPLLLANELWLAGAILCLIGLPIAAFGCRSLRALLSRQLIFVPAGILWRDPLYVQFNPILVHGENIQNFCFSGLRPNAAARDEFSKNYSIKNKALRSLAIQLDPPLNVWYRFNKGGSVSVSILKYRVSRVKDLAREAAKRNMNISFDSIA